MTGCYTREISMSCTLAIESIDSLASSRTELSSHLKWDSVFVLPAWMKVWWQAFGSESELFLRTVWQNERIIGIAPLQLRGQTASFIGSTDVCDYLDFIVAPGMERDFFTTLLDDLKQQGIERLDLRPLRPDSTVMNNLVGVSRDRGYEAICQEEGVSVELDLPSTWDEYLAALAKKQRHEVKRKLRRLWETDNADYRCIEVSGQEVGALTDTFLKLFSLSRQEKANFMTARMESFFRALAKAMAEIGVLRFGLLELDNQPVAMIMGFDYNDSMYLYNSAYDPDYSQLSVGLLSKVLCIRESIKEGKKKWDFLQGGEKYKYQIGGREIPLYRCQITIR